MTIRIVGTAAAVDSFWSRVRIVRKRRRMTTVALAEISGVPRTAIAKGEVCIGTPPRLDQALAIAHALDVPLEHLIDETLSPIAIAVAVEIAEARSRLTSLIGSASAEAAVLEQAGGAE